MRDGTGTPWYQGFRVWPLPAARHPCAPSTPWRSLATCREAGNPGSRAEHDRPTRSIVPANPFLEPSDIAALSAMTLQRRHRDDASRLRA